MRDFWGLACLETMIINRDINSLEFEYILDEIRLIKILWSTLPNMSTNSTNNSDMSLPSRLSKAQLQYWQFWLEFKLRFNGPFIVDAAIVCIRSYDHESSQLRKYKWYWGASALVEKKITFFVF